MNAMLLWLIWTLAGLIAGFYCLLRAARDLRQKHYGWGAMGLFSALIFLLTPIQTHMIKIDLPMNAPDGAQRR